MFKVVNYSFNIEEKETVETELESRGMDAEMEVDTEWFSSFVGCVV